MTLVTVEIKAVVPAPELRQSQQFDQVFGVTMPWSDEHLVHFHTGQANALLQRSHMPEHTASVHRPHLVACGRHRHRHFGDQGVVPPFGAHIGVPGDPAWCWRDFVPFDPSGGPWRIAQGLQLPA